MTKLLCGDGAAAVLLAYPEVIGVFLPEILPSVGFEQHNPHHCYTVWEHLVRSAAAVPPEPVLRWAMLLHDIGKPACFTRDAAGVGHFYDHAEKSAQMVRGILRRLRFDRRSAERIELLVRIHDRDLVCTRRSVTRALGKLGPEVLAQLLAVKRADNFAQAPAYHGRQRELDDVERLMQEILAENPCFSLAAARRRTARQDGARPDRPGRRQNAAPPAQRGHVRKAGERPGNPSPPRTTTDRKIKKDWIPMESSLFIAKKHSARSGVPQPRQRRSKARNAANLLHQKRPRPF